MLSTTKGFMENTAGVFSIKNVFLPVYQSTTAEYNSGALYIPILSLITY